MQMNTRYGKAVQHYKIGLLPAIIVGFGTGFLTYVCYRYVHKQGFEAGYKIGTPDYKDIEQILEMSATRSAKEIAEEM